MVPTDIPRTTDKKAIGLGFPLARTMSFRDLIEYTQFTRKQLQSYINNGALKFINTNMSGAKNVRYRFLTAEVDRFLERIQQTMTGAKNEYPE
jgi:hypothetical protein